jgi:predicted nucleic-acid-binding protein
MILIDTNYIIRFLTLEPLEHYQEAEKLFLQVAKREIKVAISEGIIMECYFVLLKFYKWDKSKVIDKLEKILSLKNIICNEKEAILKAFEILKTKNIDFIDALLCAKSKLYGYEVRSFDNDIRKCLNT